MRRRKVIIVSVLLLILPALLYLVSPMTTTPAAKVAVAFAGFTNDLSGAHLAVFQVTNQSDVTIRLSNEYHIEARGDDQRSDAHFFDRSATLTVGRAKIYMVPAYTNFEEWRVAFYYVPDGWRWVAFDRARRLPLSMYRFVPQSLKHVPFESLRSDWIHR